MLPNVFSVEIVFIIHFENKLIKYAKLSADPQRGLLLITTDCRVLSQKLKYLVVKVSPCGSERSISSASDREL